MIIDISPPITPRLAVFPGDTPAGREVLMDMARGDALTLSTLRATVHLGAHADAPSHYGHPARSIDEQDLSIYMGPCQVIRVQNARGRRLAPRDIPAAIHAERLLFATGTFPDPTVFNRDFAAIEPALVDHLADRGVKLIGIDTPSVDTADSKVLVAHHRFLARDVAILEGLVLDAVEPGRYELIALPLRLEGFDASPVRAVLVTPPSR
jgi:arylformamidase